MKKYKIISLFLFLFSILLSNQAFAEKLIKVGYVNNLLTINEDGEGLGYEYFKKLEKYADWKVEFVKFPSWSDGIAALNSGEIEFFGPIFYKNPAKDYSQNYIYPTSSFGFVNLYIYGKKNISRAIKNDLSKASKIYSNTHLYSSSTVESFINENELNIFLDHRFTRSNLNNILASNELLVSTDLYDNGDLQPLLRFDVAPVYYFTLRKNATLMNELDNALVELSKSNKAFATSLYYKYFPENLNLMPLLTEAEEKAVKDKKVMKIGYGIDYYPVQYQNDMGEAKGLSIDIVKLMTDKLGIEVEFIPFYRGEEQFFLDSDATVSFTESEKFISYDERSITYFKSPILAISKKDSNSLLFNRTIGALNVPSYNYTQEYGDQLKYYNNIQSLFAAFEKDEVTEILQTVFTFNSATNESNYKIMPTKLDLELKIKFSDDTSDELISALRKSYESISEQRLELIASRYSEPTINILQASFLERIFHNSKYFQLALVGFILILTIFFMIFFKKNEKINELVYETKHEPITGLLNLNTFYYEVNNVLESAESNEYMLVFVDIPNYDLIANVYPLEDVFKIIEFFTEQLTHYSKDDDIIASYLDLGKFILFLKAIPFEKASNLIKRAPVTNLADLNLSKVSMTLQLERAATFYYISDPSESIEDVVAHIQFAKKLSPKRDTNNSVVLYDQDLETMRKQFLGISLKMEDALKKHEFVPYLLPKLELQTGKIVGADLLARWHTEGNVLTPDQFIPIFEKNGFIYQLDLYMLEEACKILDDLPSFDSISINLSHLTLLQNSIVSDMSAIVKKYHVQPSCIRLEISEQTLSNLQSNFNAVVERLKSIGFTISIDSFGSDYSALALDYKLRADIIKLNKSFVESLDSEKGRILVSSLVKALQEVHYQVIAEGIETKEQLNFLQELGCYTGQGYYFAKPLQLAEFKTYVTKHTPSIAK